MKRFLSLGLLLSLSLTSCSVQAQEPPELQLEFVYKLRDKGLHDLALQYLEKLQKNPPAKFAAILPLETARTRVLLAKVKSPDERMALLKDAEKELSGYLAKKVKTPEEPQLKLELARLNSYQGQAFLSQALRQQKPEDREGYALKARTQFLDARKKFDESLKAIVNLQKTYKDPDPKKDTEFKKQLASDLLEGKFDRAKTYIFEARTYVDAEDAKERLKQAQLYEQAYNVLKDDVIDDKSNANDEVRWLAGAWAIDVARRAGKGQKAEDYYKALTDPATKYPKEAVGAQRWAKYFYILGLRDGEFQPPQGVQLSQYLQKLSGEWIKQYPKYLDTPEGHGVQYEMAHALFQQAVKLSPKYSDSKAQPYYEGAQKYFASVASSHSDLAEDANKYSIQIKLKTIGEGTTIQQLKNFEEASLKAQYEMYQMGETGKKIKVLASQLADGPKADEAKIKKEIDAAKKEQKNHLKAVIAAFQRALQLTTPLTPQFKIEEVRFNLAYIYMVSGDAYRAAIMGEYLTRKDPPSKQGPLAANYALQAYDSILKRHNEKANLDKLMDLAKYVLEDRGNNWGNEPVSSTARYYLAMVYLRQKDYEKTIDHLSKLPKDFKAYIFSQCQLAQVALNISTQAQKDGNDKKAEDYRLKALRTLQAIPKLPDNSDPATVAMFFSIQLNQGYILYNEAIGFLRDGKEAVAHAKLKEMIKFTRDLISQYPKFKDKLEEKASTQLDNALDNLGKYARLGDARLAYKNGEFDKVLAKECTGDVVAAVEALGKNKDELKLADYQVTGDLLGMALRAHVQKGNFKEASKILDLVQKVKNPSALAELQNPTATIILQSLISDLAIQVKNLRKEKDEAKLQQTIKNFSTFFDDLVNRKDVSTLKYNDIMFLANCYASLDQHAKAAELYGKLAMPQLDPKDKGNKDAEEKNKKDVQLWWFLQIRCGEQWRLAKEYKKAREVLQKIMEEPKAVGKLQAQKELNLVTEGEGNYRKGIDLWWDYMQNPSLKNQMSNQKLSANIRNKAKEIYFDAYYHYVYCYYQFSQNDGKAKEEQWLTVAANFISKLKNQHDKLEAQAKAKNETLTEATGWQLIGERFDELLKEAPKLKERYDKLQGAATSASK